ncbi:MAG: type 2 isopentenyl-diphosphate Delta-isomerase [Deltaproteobacteria bacterium]|nr:type 2 isopentenyl-diphosphate Delta-isomerase [Deltaproteobacteria bacterium]
MPTKKSAPRVTPPPPPPEALTASPSRDRKDAHLAIAAGGEAAFQQTTTLLEEVGLVHQALPERALDEISLRTPLLGKTLEAPLLIGAMTGGTPEAGEINRALAEVAAETGVGLCLGSQRPMLDDPALASTYQVREVAPEILLLANLGAMQAAELPPERVEELIAGVGADAIMIHLNPAQELMQPEGDRDFRGALAGIQRLAHSLPVPVVVKETGCGLSAETGEALLRAGVTLVEVAGAGGTSWPRVEAARAPGRAGLLSSLGEWGIPTAASLVLQPEGLACIAGGGLRDALDLARALALGAVAGSFAQPALRHLREGGPAALSRWIAEMKEALAGLCLLTGCGQVQDLARAPRILGPRLHAWQQLRARPR